MLKRGILIAVVAHAGLAQAAPLSLEEYLKQVEKSDPGYRANRQAASGSLAASEAAALAFRPQLFTNFQWYDDTRTTQVPSIQGESHIGRNLTAGLQQQTTFGLQFQLALDASQSNLLGADPALVARPTLTNVYFIPQFKFSLWQNLFGRADRADRDAKEAQARAQAYGSSYQARGILVDAEARYWKLAVTRELVGVQESSLERARALLEFDSRKAERHLVDRSELLLPQAAVKGKELELKGMRDEALAAERAFNVARGSAELGVPEELQLPAPNMLRTIAPFKRGARRGDVRAAEQAAIASESGARLAREKLLPDVYVYGSVYALGLNVSVPLDQATVSSVRSGFAEQQAAAALQYDRKRLDEEAEWADLSRRFEDAKERFELALELEKIQKAKFEAVRARRARGLTVEDQVFQYELDYLGASLARVQMEGQILGLRAQMKLYQDEDKP